MAHSKKDSWGRGSIILDLGYGCSSIFGPLIILLGGSNIFGSLPILVGRGVNYFWTLTYSGVIKYFWTLTYGGFGEGGGSNIC